MSSIFAGSHATLYDYFGGNSNLLIPEFQREFSWGEDNVNQLIADIQQGIAKLDKSMPLPQRSDTCSKFLGCLIQWDREARPIEDFVVTPGINYVNRVCELIDGQQRVSTLTLLFCEAYFQLESLGARLDLSIEQERELAGFVARVQDDWLLPRFSRSGSSGAAPKRRPVLVRQGTDKWNHAGPSQYQSSIAAYVHQVLRSIDAGRPLVKPKTVGPDIAAVVGRIEEKLSEYAQVGIDVLAAHYDQAELLAELYAGRQPVDLEAYIASSPTNRDLIVSIVALVALLHYLLHYCAFTVITSPNQDTALDMFQSLNATGVQLTAVQLLKPWVSQAFRNNGASFTSDPVFDLFEEVNSWLNSGRNSAAKTTQFFLKFGLGVFGDEPLNALSAQRHWLLGKFQSFTSGGTDLVRTRELVRLMRHFVSYLDAFYFQKRESLFSATPPPGHGSRNIYERFKLTHGSSLTTYALTDPVVTCLMFLTDAKHDLAHSFLALYFAKFQEADAANALACKQEFEKVALMVTACFVLWRGLLSEKYPDGAYRRVLARHCYTSGAFDGRAHRVGRALFRELRAGVREGGPPRRLKTSGARLAKGLKYRAGAQTLMRFVLILAAHRKVPSSTAMPSFKEHGLVVVDPAGPDYLYPDVWLGADYKSIEHVAPQKLLGHVGTVGSHWSPTFATASDSIHSIGNLTLLSSALNASTPEDPASKKNHYEGLIAPGASPGVTPTAAELMRTSALLGHLVPVYLRLSHWLDDLRTSPGAPSSNAWDEAFINRRARNIADVVMHDLLSWLTAR